MDNILNIAIQLRDRGGPYFDITGSSLDSDYALQILSPLARSRFRKTVGEQIDLDEFGANLSLVVQLLALVAVATEEIKTIPNHVDLDALEATIRISRNLYEDILPTAADEMRKLVKVLHRVRAERAKKEGGSPEFNNEHAYEEAIASGLLNREV